jgi:hypothetical protein
MEGEWLATRVPIEQASVPYEGILNFFKNICRATIGERFSCLKEKSKTSLERSVRSSSDWSERLVFHELLLEPKDHTHQVYTSRCAIAFAHAKYRHDLILADFNLAVGWSIRQTAKFSGYTVVTH